MDGVIRTFGEGLIDRDQVLHRGDLRRQIMRFFACQALARAPPTAAPTAPWPRASPRGHPSARQQRVFIHQPGEQFLVERTPVRPDPHRLAVLVGDLDDVGELRVALVLEADIAGVDAVFVERLAQAG